MFDICNEAVKPDYIPSPEDMAEYFAHLDSLELENEKNRIAEANRKFAEAAY